MALFSQFEVKRGHQNLKAASSELSKPRLLVDLMAGSQLLLFAVIIGARRQDAVVRTVGEA